jgi:hypothetical protein
MQIKQPNSRIPTYASWDDVPASNLLRAGDILPDGSTVLFRSRTTDSVSDFNSSNVVDTDFSDVPVTSIDMASMFEFGPHNGGTREDQVIGTQAKKNKWFRGMVRDFEQEAPDKIVFENTFKGT